MDKTILLLDEHVMDSTVNTENRDDYFVRKAVRAVFRDDNGRVALMYAKQRDYYKLPGGGVDEGEDLITALARELLEETGSEGKITNELGTVLEWRDFRKMKQISYGYVVSLVGAPGVPDFTQSEIDESFELRWAESLDAAIKFVAANVTHEDLEVVFMSKRDTAILQAAK